MTKRTIAEKTAARTHGSVVKVSGRVGTCFAQGDVMFRVISELPAGAKLQLSKNGRHVVAHSETGHNHELAAAGVEMFDVGDPMVCFLRLSEDAEIVHLRDFDTHKPLDFAPGTYKAITSREYVPEGWRRSSD